MDIRRLELEWLGRQNLPMWGAHLERGEPITSPQLLAWVNDGIVKAVDEPRKGYVLTDKGRASLMTRK